MAKEKKPQDKKNIKKYFIIVFGLLVLIGLLLVGYRVYISKIPPEKKVIAEVGDKKIYQSELNDAIYSLNYNDENLDRFGDKADEVKKSLLDSLIEEKILEIKAKEVGVSVSEDEILKEARNSLREFDNYDKRRQEITKRQAKAGLLKKRIAEKVVNWREGKFIVVRADLHFYRDPTGLSEKERAKLIPEDKEYAKKLADSIYNDIKSGKITFEKGMEIANNDKRVGILAWKPWKVTFSQSFSKEDSVLKPYPLFTLNFWEEIFKAPVGEVTGPVPVKIVLDEDLPLVGKKGDKIDILYLIIKVEKANFGQADSYEKWLENQKKELGVKIY